MYILFSEEAVDKYKVDIMRANITRLNPNIKIRSTLKLADKSSENELGEEYWKNSKIKIKFE